VEIVRQVIVSDAADLEAESAFCPRMGKLTLEIALAPERASIPNARFRNAANSIANLTAGR